MSRPVVTGRSSAVEAPGDAGAGSGEGGKERAVLPPPACEETIAEGGPWERAVSGEQGTPRVIGGTGGKALGGLVQEVEGRGAIRLRFLGTHVFDLLDKVAAEGGATEAEKRRTICLVLKAVAKRGAPVVRIWGTMKRTGSTEEIERAREVLGLVLDENARRARPLRFVVSLLNHQRGYGLPDPDASLDDQKASGWSAREVYLGGSWQKKGTGQLAERIEKYRETEAIRSSPYVLAWEIVNELDTFRSVAGGAFVGPEAESLVKGFLVPAAALLAESFPQPVAIGDLRGGLGGYRAFAEGLVTALPEGVRGRLVWTAHVYVEAQSPPPSEAEKRASLERATRKVDIDLEVARKLGLPFLLGEIGQLVRGAKTAYCAGGVTHDVPGLLSGVLSPAPDPHGRREIDGALFWGEGLCGLAIDASGGAGSRTLNIGAGGDSADLGPDESLSRKALIDARGWARFSATKAGP